MSATRAAPSRWRSALRGLSTVLIVAGVLLLADAVTTLLWQEPVSAFLAQRSQDRLSGDLDELERAAPSTLERRALGVLDDPSQRIAFLARAQRRRTDAGDPIGRIEIPKINANFVVVYGTSEADLEKGPGLYPATAWPGLPGTTAIAGHRTTYLAPFRHIDELDKGDRIDLVMPYARLTYEVEKRRIVQPTDVWVTHRVDHDRLVLSACHPLYSAAQRIIVFSRLVKTVPRGPAASPEPGRTLADHPSGLSSEDP